MKQEKYEEVRRQIPLLSVLKLNHSLCFFLNIIGARFFMLVYHVPNEVRWCSTCHNFHPSSPLAFKAHNRQKLGQLVIHYTV